VLKNYGTGSMVYLNSPPTTPARPSIQLRCFDFNKDSAFGEADGIFVYVFSPVAKTYVLVGFITDNPNPQYLKDLWAGTNVWKTGYENVIKLAPDQLEVYTDSTTSNGNGNRDATGTNNDMLLVKLTVPVTMTHPHINFEVPAMTLKFRPIAESYYDTATNVVLPSGYSRQPIATMRTPAWVEESVPSWFGPVSPQEVCGHIDYKYIEAITPPAT
jgi:hypothetical protein